MELEYELIKDIKSNIISLNNNINSQKKFNDNFKYFDEINSSSDKKRIKNNNNSTFGIISSVFTKKNKNKYLGNKTYNNNESIKLTLNNNIYLLNNIYNIKENSIFHIKIFDKYIKYYPIFSKLTEYERFIKYNPLIENNPNFEIISDNSIHFDFCLKNYDIPVNKFESIKEKYIKHNFTKRNINFFEEIFKYLFEEIKINISCINIQNKYEDILKNCAKLINNINEIVEEILNINQESNKNQETYIINNIENHLDKINSIQTINSKDKFCIFNNNIIKKNFILNDVNSKSIENNFIIKEGINEKEEENKNKELLEENKDMILDVNDKNENFKNP